MNDPTKPERVLDPQELERLLVVRQHAGDLEGMLALYEPQAMLDVGDGLLRRGREAIREYFAKQIATGQKFQRGAQRPPRLCGDLALTSTRLPDGTGTAEVARRQNDGSWGWVIDQFSIAHES